jgi:hypothetical protein
VLGRLGGLAELPLDELEDDADRETVVAVGQPIDALDHRVEQGAVLRVREIPVDVPLDRIEPLASTVDDLAERVFAFQRHRRHRHLFVSELFAKHERRRDVARPVQSRSQTTHLRQLPCTNASIARIRC